MAATTISKNQIDYLRELGLSKHAIRLYGNLLAKERLTASEAAGKDFVTAQYRLFYKLEEVGLARRIKGRPVKFEAVLPENALPVSFKLKETKLKQLLYKNMQPSAGMDFQMRLLVGRHALYEEYARLAKKSQKSIREYTIGIAYSEEFVKIARNAIKRGVKIQMAAQQFKASNYHILHKWQKLGMDVRLSPSERGFHLMLFDGKIVIITFSNPHNTEERLSIVTDNPAVVKLFESYFESIWQSARDVDV